MMRTILCSVALLLSSCVALPQAFHSTIPDKPATLNGIKIKESTFDPQTKTAKLTFINDSPKDIITWASCTHVTQAPGDYPKHGTCSMIDSTVSVVNYQITKNIFPSAPEWNCGGCQPIHPGQDYTLAANFGSFPEVTSSTIELIMVVFSGGTWSANEQGKGWLRGLASGNKQSLVISRQLLEIGNKILADPNDKNPVTTMIAAMKERSHLIGTSWFSVKAGNGVTYQDSLGKELTEPPDEYLRDFMRPEWRKGNNREFIPEDQRKHLQTFLQEQQMWVDYLTKNQIVGLEAAP
jgi:hypothetical protein